MASEVKLNVLACTEGSVTLNFTFGSDMLSLAGAVVTAEAAPAATAITSEVGGAAAPPPATPTPTPPVDLLGDLLGDVSDAPATTAATPPGATTGDLLGGMVGDLLGDLSDAPAPGGAAGAMPPPGASGGMMGGMMGDDLLSLLDAPPQEASAAADEAAAQAEVAATVQASAVQADAEADDKMRHLASSAAKAEAQAAAQAELEAAAKAEAEADKMRLLAAGAAKATAMAAARAEEATDEAQAEEATDEAQAVPETPPNFAAELEEAEAEAAAPAWSSAEDLRQLEGQSRKEPPSPLTPSSRAGDGEAFEVIEPMPAGLTVAPPAPAPLDVMDRVREAAKAAAGTATETAGWAARRSSEILPSRADLGEAATAAKALASSTTAEATSVVAEWWGYMRGAAPAAAK